MNPSPNPQQTQQPEPLLTPLALLTDREIEVAVLVSFAHTDREIATKLFVTVDTAKAHVKSICSKLGLANRTAICRWVLVLQYEKKITLLGNVL